MATATSARKKTAKKQSKATQVTDVIFILDESSSMQSCKAQAIDGFNEHVDTIRKNASDPAVGDTRVSLIVFSDVVRVVYNRQPLDTLEKLDDTTYHPNGNTAWLNAIDTAIELMKALPDYNDPQHAYLMLNVTDGAENASQHREPHATWDSIAAKTTEIQATGRWTISVIGANIDLADVSKRMHIPQGNVIAYASTPTGTQSANVVAASATGNYFGARSRGVTASADYMASVTGGAAHVDDVQNPTTGTGGPISPPFHPTLPPQQPGTPPQQPRTPRARTPRKGPNEGQIRGGSTTGAKSPLLGG